MLSTKRNQIRTHIRRAEMQHQFAIKRRQLVQGRQGLARQLFKEVQKDIFAGTNMHLIGKLIAYQKENPLDQNTYVLISNYLFDHNEDLAYFYPILIYQPRYLQHHMWCLVVVAMILSQKTTKNQLLKSYVIHQQIGQLLENANDVGQILLENLKSNYQKSQIDTQIWQYYLEIIKLVFYNQIFEEFPRRSVELFVEIMTYSQKALYNNEELITIWKFMISLLDAYSRQIQPQTLVKLFLICSEISEYVLISLPEERPQCIQLFKTLIFRHPTEFMSLIYRQTLMKQVLYLLSEVISLKPTITSLLKLIISQCNLQQLRFLFQSRAHIILTETMEWAINAANNACLEDCLITLYNILSFLKSQNESKMLLRVTMEIQCANFDKMIQGLSSNHQTDVIWRFLTLIIDDFYSSQDNCQNDYL